jgi:hypothetical protein
MRAALFDGSKHIDANIEDPTIAGPRCAMLAGGRDSAGSAFGVIFEKFDGIADGENGLCCVIGDFAGELFLERHNQFNRVETVGAEIVDEACSFDHLVGLDSQMLHDDLLNPLGNVTHRSNLVL